MVKRFENPVVLKSGRKSHWYVDWRSVCSDVFLADRLADYVVDFANRRSLGVDSFYGVPEGATKLGLLVQYKWAKGRGDFGEGRYSFAMGRGKPKEHGLEKDRYFIGFPRGRVFVIEDVVTTGGSLIDEMERLERAGAEVGGAIVLTDRSGGLVQGKMKERGWTYFPFSFFDERRGELSAGDCLRL